MDEESHSTSQYSSNSREAVQMNNGVTLLFVNRREVHCDLCQTIYSPGNEANRHRNLCQGCERWHQPYNVETSQVLVEPWEQDEEDQWDLEEFLQHIRPHWKLVERYVEGLPRVIITEEHGKKHNGLVCAICLDPLSAGCIVNQLPCLHFFHPLCIVPWLKVRMSCPTCRYELSYYETTVSESLNSSSTTSNINELEVVVSESLNSSYPSTNINEPEVVVSESLNSSSTTSNINELEVVVSESHNETTDSSVRDREGGKGGWFLFVAAPIVSLVGIALVECFQNLLGDGRGRGSTGHVEFPDSASNKFEWSLLVARLPGHPTQGRTLNRRWLM